MIALARPSVVLGIVLLLRGLLVPTPQLAVLSHALPAAGAPGQIFIRVTVPPLAPGQSLLYIEVVCSNDYTGWNGSTFLDQHTTSSLVSEWAITFPSGVTTVFEEGVPLTLAARYRYLTVSGHLMQEQFGPVGTITFVPDGTRPLGTTPSASRVDFQTLELTWVEPPDRIDGADADVSAVEMAVSSSPLTDTNFDGPGATRIAGVPLVGRGNVATFTTSSWSDTTTWYLALRFTDVVGNVSTVSDPNAAVMAAWISADTGAGGGGARCGALAGVGTSDRLALLLVAGILARRRVLKAAP